MNPNDVVVLVEQRKWVALSAVLIGLAVRLVKSDTVFPTVKGTWRVHLALALGIASGVLEKVADGVTWTSAIIGGLVAAAFAIIGHDVLIGSLRAGKELPLPAKLLVPGAPPEEGKPVTRPQQDAIPDIEPKE